MNHLSVITIFAVLCLSFSAFSQKQKGTYSNGKIKYTGQLENNKKSGEWNYYTVEGDLIAKGIYENGIKTGYWLEIDQINPSILSFDDDFCRYQSMYMNVKDNVDTVNIKADEKKWFVDKINSRSYLKIQGNYSDGLKQGKWIYTDLKGKVLIEMNYLDDIADGSYMESVYNRYKSKNNIDGKQDDIIPIFEGSMKKGRKNGACKMWFSGYKTSQQGYFIGNYLDDLKHGLWTEYYGDLRKFGTDDKGYYFKGQLKSDRSYSMGVLHGESIEVINNYDYENKLFTGLTLRISNYDNGLLDGPYNEKKYKFEINIASDPIMDTCTLIWETSGLMKQNKFQGNFVKTEYTDCGHPKVSYSGYTYREDSMLVVTYLNEEKIPLKNFVFQIIDDNLQCESYLGWFNRTGLPGLHYEDPMIESTYHEGAIYRAVQHKLTQVEERIFAFYSHQLNETVIDSYLVFHYHDNGKLKERKTYVVLENSPRISRLVRTDYYDENGVVVMTDFPDGISPVLN